MLRVGVAAGRGHVGCVRRQVFVADAADMAMDEGERNMTSWTKAHQELGELRSRVAANTHAIEVRRCREPNC